MVSSKDAGRSGRGRIRAGELDGLVYRIDLEAESLHRSRSQERHRHFHSADNYGVLPAHHLKAAESQRHTGASIARRDHCGCGGELAPNSWANAGLIIV